MRAWGLWRIAFQRAKRKRFGHAGTRQPLPALTESLVAAPALGMRDAEGGWRVNCGAQGRMQFT